MPTSASNSGRGQKISLPTCLPSNRRSWRHEEAYHLLKHNSRVINGDLSLVAFARELDGIAEQIDKDLADRKFKRPFGAAPAGAPPSTPRWQRAAPPACRGSPPERLAARRCAAPRTLAGARQASQDGGG